MGIPPLPSFRAFLLVLLLVIVMATAASFSLGRWFERKVALPTPECIIEQLQMMPLPPKSPSCDMKNGCYEI